MRGLESIVDSDGDGYTDDAEETVGTSAIDASDFPMLDFSDSVDEIIGEGSGLDTIESNLKFWFDASNIDAESNATLTDGDAISRWRDLSGNGFDATQGTASRQPTIINNTQNGMSGVNFPGAANNGLLTSGTSDEVIGDFAMIVVAKIDTSQDMHTIAGKTLDGFGNWENYTDWSLIYRTSNGNLSGSVTASSYATGRSATYNVIPSERFYILTMNYDESSIQLYVDGVLIEDNTTSFTLGHNHDFVIGFSHNASRVFKGEILEIITFDQDLNANELMNIHYYLSSKWGLESTVDSDSDGHTDAAEETAGTSALNASDFPMPDFSDSIDAQIGEASGLDSIESNVELWLDSSNIDFAYNATLTDGDAISEWKDLSGNDYHAQQANASNQPSIKLNALNSNATVLFTSSSSHYMKTLPFNTQTGEITIVSVFKTGSTIDGRVYYHTGEPGGSIAFRPKSDGVDGWNYSSTENKSRGSATSTGTIAASSANLGSYSYKVNVTAVAMLNGNNKVTSTDTANPINQTGNDGKMIGAHPNPTDYWNGEIAELIVFDKQLSDDELAKVNYYLSKKWGLESTVDSDADGHTDDAEETAGTSAIDASDSPMPDFSDTVDAQIGAASGLEAVESNQELVAFDASNVDI